MLEPIDFYQPLVMVGIRSEHIVAPCCYTCRLPIIEDLSNAIFETDTMDITAIGTLDGDKAFMVGSRLRAFHKGCAGPREGVWVQADNVVKFDQRYHFEKG